MTSTNLGFASYPQAYYGRNQHTIYPIVESHLQISDDTIRTNIINPQENNKPIRYVPERRASKILCIALVYVSLNITYVIISIAILTKSSFDDYYSMCKESKIMIYLIYTVIVSSIYCDIKDVSEFICFENIKIIITISWGMYELFIPKCICNLKNRFVYNLCFIYWLFYTCIILSNFVFALCICIYSTFAKNYVESKPTEPNVVINPIIPEPNVTPNITEFEIVEEDIESNFTRV
jgi:hypothetical protein